MRLLQVAPFWQGEDWHSLVLTSQLVPSKPSGHVQRYEAPKLTHVAPFWQGLELQTFTLVVSLGRHLGAAFLLLPGRWQTMLGVPKIWQHVVESMVQGLPTRVHAGRAEAAAINAARKISDLIVCSCDKGEARTGYEVVQAQHH